MTEFSQEEEFTEELTIKVRKGLRTIDPILHYYNDGVEFIVIARADAKKTNTAVPTRARVQTLLEAELVEKLSFPPEKAKPCGCSGAS